MRPLFQSSLQLLRQQQHGKQRIKQLHSMQKAGDVLFGENCEKQKIFSRFSDRKCLQPPYFFVGDEQNRYSQGNSHLAIIQRKNFSTESTSELDENFKQVKLLLDSGSENEPDLSERLSYLMEAYCSKGVFQKTEEILYFLEERDLEKPKHFSLVIESYLNFSKINDSAVGTTKNVDSTLHKKDDKSAIKLSQISIAQRAQTLLNQMEQEYKKCLSAGIISSDALNVKDYNSVIYMWSMSDSQFFASKAHDVLNQMAKLYSSMKTHQSSIATTRQQIMPNSETYSLLVRAWSRSNESIALNKATFLLRQMLDNFSTETLVEYSDTIALDDFKLVLYALSDSKRGSAFMAQRLLDSMQDFTPPNSDKSKTDEDDDSSTSKNPFKPDAECYSYVLKAWANYSSQNYHFKKLKRATKNKKIKLPHDYTEEILSAMKFNGVRLNQDCFMSAIQTFSNSIFPTYKDQDSAQRLEMLDGLLKEMENTCRNVDIAIKPTQKEYYHVINGFLKSRSNESAVNILGVLNRMKQMRDFLMQNSNEDEDTVILPTSPSIYTSAILSWINHQNNTNKGEKYISKAEMAIEMYHSMIKDDFLSMDEGDSAEQSIAITRCYNGLLKVCASVAETEHSQKEKQEAFRIVLESWQDLSRNTEINDTTRLSTVRPDQMTFKLLLSCSKLSQRTKHEKSLFIEKVFQSLCLSGYVDHSIIEEVGGLVSQETFHELIGSKTTKKGTNLINLNGNGAIYTYPPSWGRNLKSKEGAKSNEIKTNNYDSRMDNIRQKKNQRLLRGGRLQ